MDHMLHLGQLPLCHRRGSVVFSEADAHQTMRRAERTCRGPCRRQSHIPTRRGTGHLLAGEELPLVLVDHGVTCGHRAVLVPGNGTQEVSRVGQTVGP